MKPLTKGIAVALIQVLIVCSLGAKLLYDRRTRPQAWFLTRRYDPNLPIRGRYINLQIEVNDSRSPEETQKKFANEIQGIENQNSRFNAGMNNFGFGQECGSIVASGGAATAEFDDSPAYNCKNLAFMRWRAGGETRLRLDEPILFFISDTAKDPSRLPAGDEMWVLATIPRKGPPRPIALGVKKAGETAITPLGLN